MFVVEINWCMKEELYRNYYLDMFYKCIKINVLLFYINNYYQLFTKFYNNNYYFKRKIVI